MNRLALFAEGYTEILFLERLIEEIAGKHNVLIEQIKILGGKRTLRSMRLIKAARPNTGQKYFVLLIDCGGDESVKTRIQEEHENLTNKGYSGIIGIRDVRPKFTHQDIPKLEAGLPLHIKTSLVPVVFILSIMEIEAWFLSEATHFSRIDPRITLASIRSNFGFDPENDNMEQRLYPADDLNACYAIGGKAYLKHNAQITINSLDYTVIYIELRNKIKYLDRLISSIDAFLA
jgi:hypothetical protein